MTMIESNESILSTLILVHLCPQSRFWNPVSLPPCCSCRTLLHRGPVGCMQLSRPSRHLKYGGSRPPTDLSIMLVINYIPFRELKDSIVIRLVLARTACGGGFMLYVIEATMFLSKLDSPPALLLSSISPSNMPGLCIQWRFCWSSL